MKYQAIRGTKDVAPDEAPRWQAMEASARALFRAFGYREIRTPVIEDTGLFVKSVGEDTDIVKKEMFSFLDRGERHISLRPEGTAPIIRAYLENNLGGSGLLQKLYYIGPMFRAERPQAGRLRQFHQIGVEAIGSYSPVLDAEVIALLARLLGALGIPAFEMRLNNLGCPDDKAKLSAHLKAALTDPATEKLLCDDCRRRSATNPLRVLDCKNEQCRKVVRASVAGAGTLCGDCHAHFDAVRRHLDALGAAYVIDPYIVRGLDYYTRTVFEAVSGALGAQNALGAGGRYDRLISDMGGPERGACGFAIGMERALMALGEAGAPGLRADALDLFIASLGAAAAEKAFGLAGVMRANGISCDIDFDGRSLKSQMRTADAAGARYVLIIGDDELAKGEAVLRDMRTKEQTSVRFEDAGEKLRALLQATGT